MKKHNDTMKISQVKAFIYRPISALVLSVIAAGAQGADEIDVDVIPHAFSNGTAADALEVNANFEFLRNNLDLLVAMVQEQKDKIALLETGAAAQTFELSVDCAGGTLSEVVDPILDAAFPGNINVPVDISVSGTCTGNTTIDIDDVTIKSANPGTPAVFTGSIVILGAGNHLELENLDITVSSGNGLVCAGNGSLRGTDLSIQLQGAGTGVLAVSKGFCELNNSTITGPGAAGRGVATNLGGYVILRAVSVTGFNFGLNPAEDSRIWVGPLAGDGGTVFSEINENNTGVLAFAGGSVSLTSVDISGNTNQGLFLQPGGSALFAGNNEATTIDDNGTGIELHPGSYLYSYFGSTAAIISNNDTGIRCSWFEGNFALGTNIDLTSVGGNGLDNANANDNCTNLPE